MLTPRSGTYEPSYTTCPALGTNQKVRNAPVNRQTIIEYIAISPSMNDQWSGKTFLARKETPLAAPRRSSIQPAMPPRGFWAEARSSAWRWPARRAEDDLAVLSDVEGRLVARAQQVVGLLLVEAHGTTDVRADLRVGEGAVDAPVLGLLHGDQV